ncbi:43925_t:CDS:1, partial [Gigaspora margarita]
PDDWTVCLTKGIKDEKKTFNLGEMTEIQRGQMQALLDKYQDVFAYEPAQLRRTTIVQHEIH